MGTFSSINVNATIQSSAEFDFSHNEHQKIIQKQDKHHVKNESALISSSKFQQSKTSQVLKEIYSSKRSMNKSITQMMRRSIEVPQSVNNIFLYNNSVHHQNETIVTGAIKRSVSQSEKPVVEMKNHPYGPTFEIKSRNSKN